MITLNDIPDYRGKTAFDQNGVTVGTLETSFVEPGTGRPLWASVRRDTSGEPDRFVPLEGASALPGADGTTVITLTVDAAEVDASPHLDLQGGPFTDETAHVLGAYYGHHPTRADPAGSAADPAVWVIRSEERLRVHTETTPTERVRLRKVIVTEEKSFTVTLRREEFQLVREPYDPSSPATGMPEAASGFDLVLHEERPVVTTEIVPVERVHADIVQITDSVPVSGTIRKERVDTTIITPDTAPPSI